MKNIGELMKKAQQVQTQMAALQTKMEHLPVPFFHFLKKKRRLLHSKLQII